MTDAVKICRADPLTPPEKHIGKGEECTRHTTVLQQGANNCCAARRSIFLEREPLMGDPVTMVILHPKNFVALGPEDW